MLIVDDDQLYSNWAQATLEHQGGVRAVWVQTPDEALSICSTEAFDAVIIDLRMPHGAVFTSMETAAGTLTGLALARALRIRSSEITLLIQSQDLDLRVERAFVDDRRVHVVRKSWDASELLRVVSYLVGARKRVPNTFIVHGRDDQALLELKNFLQNGLGFQEPMVLREQPSGTATLLEKFEAYAQRADIVFALLTPDDHGRRIRTRQADLRRARQNVVFELGYFLCYTKHHDRKLIVLSKGALELPSDIAGLVTIDIAQGVEASGELIRRELRSWLSDSPPLV